MEYQRSQIVIDGVKLNYEIDTDGRIWNTNSDIELKGWIGKRGYRVVCLRINPDEAMPRFVKKTIHQLVALTFIPNPDNKPQVNHKDGNKLNNCVDNLEWVTNKENYDHARSHGLIKTGDELSYATVDNETVEKMCALLEKGYRNIDILAELGLPYDSHGKALVTRVRTGKGWKDISSKYDFIKTGSLRKVPEEVIHLICQELEKGAPLREIYETVGIDNHMEYPAMKSLVSDIRTRRSWKDISKDYNF